MGQSEPHDKNKLSKEWIDLSKTLVSGEYKKAVSNLVSIPLIDCSIEINLFHYTSDSWMGPHLDVKDKIVTHVLYFNEKWNIDDGGNLAVLRSKNIQDAVTLISPIIGNSFLLVR